MKMKSFPGVSQRSFKQDGCAAGNSFSTKLQLNQVTKPTNNKLILSGNHLELTAALKTSVAKKSEKFFQHESRIDQFRVELSRESAKSPQFRAQGHISIQGPDFVAAETSADMYHAIEEMVKKLDRMLRNRARQERKKRTHPHPIDLPSVLAKV